MFTAFMLIHAHGFWLSDNPNGRTEHMLFSTIEACERAKPRVHKWMLDRGLNRITMKCETIKESTS